MKLRVVFVSLAIALFVGAVACARALAEGPSQITFNIVGPTDGSVQNLRWGNMVSPDGSCQFWDNGPAGNPTYVWNNMGNNLTKFALELNYDMEQSGTWVAATVHGIVIVDPTAMPDGSVSVTAELQKCSMGPNNIVLGLKGVKGPSGVSMGNCAAVPPCEKWQ
ncbi:hypothetical protein Deba_1565 [Desulfarculus baarsii DSM 2075]|uniref:Uncharacterized protein n=1 Tax=Desulfarculus baarsii (strain ATCC 33931 / DSM 2075 / LMG 7858 / VKM B-1802 / 2st14) TaxID=644282 RepID=E1QH90_DESB2|nr:hypothetical protein [Desulfarculus baarsii]ADK84933.1 hypothetical protein Deba_1565 [Desulfarculus baarsii DSM 2075]